MWVIIKSNKNELEVLKSSLKHNFGKDCNFYYPKFKSKSNLLNKTIIKETKILGDYIFCFHKDFVNTSNIKCLNFLRGVKYVLKGSELYQKDINEFILKCKSNEDHLGYLNYDISEVNINSEYKFVSGIFKNKIFKILNIQNKYLKVMLNGINTTINKKNCLFFPA
tara:strand:+ start:5932 stop:6429 length:498 start_codon:yes stop_codon:yes gene_type:complete